MEGPVCGEAGHVARRATRLAGVPGAAAGGKVRWPQLELLGCRGSGLPHESLIIDRHRRHRLPLLLVVLLDVVGP
eukprot:scaffold200562_cov34-Tisochrysis_lutea.AAC.5